MQRETVINLALAHTESRKYSARSVFSAEIYRQDDLMKKVEMLLKENGDKEKGLVVDLWRLFKNSPSGTLWWIVVFCWPTANNKDDAQESISLLISDSGGHIYEFKQ